MININTRQQIKHKLELGTVTQVQNPTVIGRGAEKKTLKLV